MARQEGFLTRSRLRDVVILLSFCSAFFFDAGPTGLVLSLFILAIGSFLHVLAKGVLIRNEVLCKDGIYAVVRHPYYLANYLVDTGFCLASGNKYLLLCYPFLFFWSYGPTLGKEERTLLERHGEAVVEQIMTTPQLYPDRRSASGLGALLRGFSFSRISAKEVWRNIRFWLVWLGICVVGSPGVSGIPARHDVTRCLFPVAVCVALLGVFTRMGQNRGSGT